MWFACAVLEQAAGLPSRALHAIGELEREVVEADGGRLKLRLYTSIGFTPLTTEDYYSLPWPGARPEGSSTPG